MIQQKYCQFFYNTDGGICLDLNYSVINEMKQNKMNSQLEQKLEAETVFVFYWKYSFMHWSINDNYSVKKCLNFLDFFKTKQNEMNSS